MFASFPEDRFHVPAGLSAPSAQYWKTISVSSNMAWYLLTVSIEGAARPQQTFLFWRDAELVRALIELDMDFDSLMCFVPPTTTEGGGWQPLPISEVWYATNSSAVCDATPLFVTADGDERSGPLGGKAQCIKRERLIAKEIRPACHLPESHLLS